MGNSSSYRNSLSSVDTKASIAQSCQKFANVFSHNQPACLKTSYGPIMEAQFGRVIDDWSKINNLRQVILTMEEKGISVLEKHARGSNFVEVSYCSISEIGFDHARDEVRFFMPAPDIDNVIVLSVSDSIDLEKELFCRMAASEPVFELPKIVHIGICAGFCKPKLTQRQRSIISMAPLEFSGDINKLRAASIRVHSYSGVDSSPGSATRHNLAMEYIVHGHNSFPVITMGGHHSPLWSFGATLQLSGECIIFRTDKLSLLSRQPAVVNIPYSFVDHWNIVDNSHCYPSESGVDVFMKSGDHWFFGLGNIERLKHTLEYFWNQHLLSEGRQCMPGSTNGRNLWAVLTLSGHRVVSTHLKDDSRIMLDCEESPVPDEYKFNVGNIHADTHLRHAVKHQGWMLKRVGQGDLSWTPRYFILYETPQGHFLVYYNRCDDIPLFSDKLRDWNFIDLATVRCIRPKSVLLGDALTPPFAFDIVAFDIEWTVCAANITDLKLWVQVFSHCIDEDAPILPDQSISFLCKASVDPWEGFLSSRAYDVTLTFSAVGLTLSAERINKFWSYYDIYDWSVISPSGNLSFKFRVFEDGRGTKLLVFIVRTSEAGQLAQCLEFFIEKSQFFASVSAEVDYIDQNRLHNNKDSSVRDAAGDDIPLNFCHSCDSTDVLSSLTTNFTSDISMMQSPTDTRVKKSCGLSIMQRYVISNWLSNFMVKGEGPLFDDKVLQIAARVIVDGAVAELTLYYRNHAYIDINDLKCIFSTSSECLCIDARNLARCDLSPGGVTKQTVFLTYADVSPCASTAAISYLNTEAGVVCTESFCLPISASSFMKPWGLTASEFLVQWQAIFAEETEVFSTPRPLDRTYLLTFLVEVLGFCIVEGLLDSSGSVLYGAGKLCCASATAGVQCFMRMEAHFNHCAVRVTVRSLDTAVCDAIIHSTNFTCCGWS